MTTIPQGKRAGIITPHFTDKVQKHKELRLGSCSSCALLSSDSNPGLISITAVTDHHFQGHSKVGDNEWYVDGKAGTKGKKLLKAVSVWYTKYFLIIRGIQLWLDHHLSVTPQEMPTLDERSE